MQKTKCLKGLIFQCMRVGLLPVILISLSACLAYANPADGQEITDRKITLTVDQAEIKSVLNQISRKTDVKFVYSAQKIPCRQKVSFSVENEKLGDVLNKLLQPYSIRYEVVGDKIILRKKDDLKNSEAVVENTGTLVDRYVAPKTITGKVTDNEGKELSGVSVTVKGTSKGVSTNTKGEFVIDANQGDVLEFSIIGYKSLSATVGSGTAIAVKMEVDVTGLTDVVVVGYGKQKKVSVVGAIATVQTKELKQSPAANLSNALVGRLPGLIAVQNSGEPGFDGAALYIRGINSFSGSNSPLVLVDGIQRSFSNLDANEVESVSILKDASATAVYGVAGANGVILVTTKRGKEGPAQVSFSAENSIQTPTRLPEFLDSYNYATLLNEANENEGKGQFYAFSADDIQKFKDGSDPYGHPNTDFLEELLRKYSRKTTYNLNISGGTKTARYFINAGYLFQDGAYKKFDNDDYDANAIFKRYNFRSNIDVDLTEDMTIGLDLAGRIEHRHFPGTSAAAIFGSIYRHSPTAYPLYTPDGKFGGSTTFSDNPAGRISKTGYSDGYTSAIQGTFRMSRKLSWITPGLSANVSFAFDNSSVFTRSRSQNFAVYIYNPTTKEFNKKSGTDDTPLSDPSESTGGAYNQSVLEASVNYQKQYREHDFTGMVLYTQRTRNIQGAQYAKPFINQGLVGRITWNWKDKYFAEFNGRYDGSENFAKGKQFGFFPSVAAGWVISQENFFDRFSAVINFLKLRGSFGLVGNDGLSGRRFLFQSIYSSANNVYVFGDNPGSVGGLAENAIGNPDVTWENAQIADIGFESRFLNNKITLNFDLYRQQREDLLITRGTIPAIVGASLPAVNLGKTDNKGFEVEVEYRDRVGKLSYFVKANTSFTRNKVVFADEAEQKYEYQSITGQRIFQPFGLVFDGFYKDAADIAKSPVSKFGPVQPGDMKYRDVNGDGLVDAFDRVPIGHPNVPEWIFGASAGVSFKGLDLSVLFQGSRNSTVYLQQEAAWEFFNGGKVLDHHLGRWTPATADIATYPVLHTAENTNNHTQTSDFWQKSGNYIRLKNAEIGYTLPKAWVNKIKIKSARFYLTGLNLITWDKVKTFDPEAPSGRGWFYPQQKIFNAGVNIVF